MKYLASVIEHSRQPARRADSVSSAQPSEPSGDPRLQQPGTAQRVSEPFALPVPAATRSISPMVAEDDGREDNPVAAPSRDTGQTGDRPVRLETAPPEAALSTEPLRPVADAFEMPFQPFVPSPPGDGEGEEDLPVSGAGSPMRPARSSTVRDAVHAAPEELPQGRSGPSIRRCPGGSPPVPPGLESGVMRGDGMELPDALAAGYSQPGHEKPAVGMERPDPGPRETVAGKEPAREMPRTVPAGSEASVSVQPQLRQAQPFADQGRIPRQSAPRPTAPEVPQVRIGQINVLVEDQAPAAPKRSTTGPRPAAANPFGLRGL